MREIKEASDFQSPDLLPDRLPPPLLTEARADADSEPVQDHELLLRLVFLMNVF